MNDATYEVLAIKYGSLHARRSDLFASYPAYGEDDGPMAMDYFFWIVRNEDRLIVIDTGFEDSVGRARGRETTCPPHIAFERLGLSPNDVDTVFLTHFHYDHIGNTALFGNARFVTAAAEFGFWTGPYGAKRCFAQSTERHEIAQVTRLREQGRVDLFPEEFAQIPGLVVQTLPGHTHGQLIVSVRTAGRTVVLASDSAHHYEEYRRDMPFHIYADLQGMYAGLNSLREMDALPDHVVVPGHDPDVLTAFPPYDPDDPDFAVVLS